MLEIKSVIALVIQFDFFFRMGWKIVKFVQQCVCVEQWKTPFTVSSAGPRPVAMVVAAAGHKKISRRFMKAVGVLAIW